MMKKNRITVAFVLFSFLFQVQEGKAQYAKMGDKVTLGISGGPDFCSFNGAFSGSAQYPARSESSNGYIVGFSFGVNADIPFSPDFYFQPGILFEEKGGRISSLQFHSSNIDIPFFILYKSALSLYSINMLIGVGPYVGFGVGGKVNYAGVKTPIVFSSASDSEILHNDNVYLKNPDGGLAFMLGFELANRLSFLINTNLGLLNLQYGSVFGSSASKLSNLSFGVGVGYRFK